MPGMLCAKELNCKYLVHKKAVEKSNLISAYLQTHQIE